MCVKCDPTNKRGDNLKGVLKHQKKGAGRKCANTKDHSLSWFDEQPKYSEAEYAQMCDDADTTHGTGLYNAILLPHTVLLAAFAEKCLSKFKPIC